MGFRITLDHEMKPGIYDTISNHDYHAGPGISKSGLDLVSVSPLHLIAKKSEPQGVPSHALYFGTAFHSLILEPEDFAKSFVLALEIPPTALDKADDMKAKCKELGLPVSGTKSELTVRLKTADPTIVFAAELEANFAAANVGKTILNQKDWDALHSMRAAVRAHPMASKILALPGKSEQSIYWNDPETGELCRCRTDRWAHAAGIIADLKTCEDASPDGFAKSIAGWRYHVQDAYYTDGIAHAIEQAGIEDIPAPTRFLFIAVQKDARVVDGKAFGVGVYSLDADGKTLGRVQYRENLDFYASCKKSGEWPCYGDKVTLIPLPGWYLNRNIEKLST